MKIRAHGVIWSDTAPGVWTAIVPVIARLMTAYAVECRIDDGVLQLADVCDAEYQPAWLWRAILDSHDGDWSEDDLVSLNGTTCAIIIVA